LAPQVALELATLRLTAVRANSLPAATGCYKPLSFVQFSPSLHFVNCYLYTTDYALF